MCVKPYVCVEKKNQSKEMKTERGGAEEEPLI